MLLRLPYGLKDELPEDIYQRKEIDEKAFRIFEKWGYLPTSPPTFELYEILALGAGEKLKKQMYRFIDRGGELLALRPEFTTPIARMVAGKFREFALPMRFFYFGKVYRYFPQKVRHLREFYQLGAELIGVVSPYGEFEILSLFMSLLKEFLGDEQFFVDVSHADFIRGILCSIFREEKEREKVVAALENRRFVLVKEMLDGTEMTPEEREILLRLPAYRGGVDMLDEVLSYNLPESSLKAVESLKELLLKLSDYTDVISVDLSLARGLNYYTGIVFEAFSRAGGLALGGGGRYDNLLKRLGPDYPAIGFAIDIESLKRFVKPKVHDVRKRGVVLNVSCEDVLARAVEITETLRYMDVPVELTYIEDREELKRYLDFRKPAYGLDLDSKGSIRIVWSPDEEGLTDG